MTNKILFLDIDGVLNSVVSRKLNRPANNDEFYICTHNAKILNLLFLKDPNIKVVIISNWKDAISLSEINRLFKASGLNCNVCDKTEFKKSRAEEVKQYIDEHNIEKYCIIDDENWFYEEQSFYHVYPDSFDGITYRNLQLVFKFLNIEML